MDLQKTLRFLSRNVLLFLKGEGLGFADKVRLKLKGAGGPLQIKYHGKPFTVTHASSFISMYEELVLKGIYAFKADDPAPYIIDCGANIGLSIAYFKRMYPQAKILAFEADKATFDVLQNNVNAGGFSNVEVCHNAVWVNNEELSFVSEGGLSGHLGEGNATKQVNQVRAIRLKELLNEPVDLLKIDIEGAEHEVMKDCADNLGKVKLLFVEYHSETDKPQELQVILDIITKAGFRYHIQEANTTAQPFMGIIPMLHMDLQLNIFAYRA